MSIQESLTYAVFLKDNGKYLDALYEFDCIESLTLENQDIQTLDLSLFYWEFAKLKYILGDYIHSLEFFDKSKSLINSISTDDLPKKLLSSLQTLNENICFCFDKTAKTLNSFENNEFYEGYLDFRSSFDPYLKEYGDFDMELANFIVSSAKKLGITLTKISSKPTLNNNTYFLEFWGESFFLSLVYVKNFYESGELKRNTQVKIVDLNLTNHLRGIGLSCDIINCLFEFITSKNGDLFTARVPNFTNISWCNYLIDNGAIVISDGFYGRSPILQFQQLLPVKPKLHKFINLYSMQTVPKGKLWTIQKKSVLDYVLEHGIYQPIIQDSDFVRENPNLHSLYSHLLTSFNKHNKTNATGLIFSFFYESTDGIHYIQNIDEFFDVIKSKSFALHDVWDKLIYQEDAVILELQYDMDFNPFFIDINDFKMLTPPIAFYEPYNETNVRRIVEDLMSGIKSHSPMPSLLIQGHSTCIKREQILNVYKPFKI